MARGVKSTTDQNEFRLKFFQKGLHHTVVEIYIFVVTWSLSGIGRKLFIQIVEREIDIETLALIPSTAFKAASVSSWVVAAVVIAVNRDKEN